MIYIRKFFGETAGNRQAQKQKLAFKNFENKNFDLFLIQCGRFILF